MGKYYVFLFQKDEDDILEQWINYHAEIVGYKNIVIVDHNSSSSSLEILRKYKYEHGIQFTIYKGAYSNKGKVLSREMKRVKDADLLIPLDADEFIVTHREQKISSNPIHILEDLDKMRDYKTGRLIFSKIYNLVNTLLYPELKDLCHFKVCNYNKQQKNSQLPKSFFFSKKFISTDIGNHYGQVNKTNIIYQRYTDNLALLHFQIRGVPHFKKKSIKSSVACQYDMEKQPSVNFGKHWKDDYLLFNTHGPEMAFKQKYLKKIDEFTTTFQLMPIKNRVDKPVMGKYEEPIVDIPVEIIKTINAERENRRNYPRKRSRTLPRPQPRPLSLPQTGTQTRRSNNLRKQRSRPRSRPQTGTQTRRLNHLRKQRAQRLSYKNTAIKSNNCTTMVVHVIKPRQPTRPKLWTRVKKKGKSGRKTVRMTRNKNIKRLTTEPANDKQIEKKMVRPRSLRKKVKKRKKRTVKRRSNEK